MLKHIKSVFRNTFGFSRTETNGALVLIFLMLMMWFISPAIKNFYNPLISDLEKDHFLLDSLAAELERHQTMPEHFAERAGKEYFLFDPNTESLEGFLALGISENLANRILKYRVAGGSFKSKRDLLKVYGFPEDTYKELFDYINLPEHPEPLQQRQVAYKQATLKEENNSAAINIIDINTADTLEFKKFKGIGSVLSRRIIAYRNSLGGFTDIYQIREVYGLSEEVAESLFPYLKVSPDFTPKKVKLNSVSADELAAHPYITKKVANKLIAYRGQHGKFSSESSFQDIKDLDWNGILKALPYLDFD